MIRIITYEDNTKMRIENIEELPITYRKNGDFDSFSTAALRNIIALVRCGSVVELVDFDYNNSQPKKECGCSPNDGESCLFCR